jgi:alcohol dehydrogenase class IV
MNALTIYQPKKLSFGENVYMGLCDDLRQAGCKRLFVVTGSFMMKVLEPLVLKLNAEGIVTQFHTSLSAEPTFNDFHEIAAQASAFGADVIAGIGGGSVMDVAKLVAALMHNPSELDSVVGIGLLKSRPAWLICIPTTSGTGSEMSPNSILLDTRDNAKKGIISPYLVPDIVYIDPLLTVGLPAEITAYTGLDALTHCIEAYCNANAHPLVDIYALKGIELIGKSLCIAVNNGTDMAARTDLALGSMYGGMCLGPVNTAAVHALAYPLGSEHKMAHGLSNAMLLPYVMEFNLLGNEKRYAEVAVALGVVHSGSFADTAIAGIAFLKEMMLECHLPKGLSALGVAKTDFPKLAEGAMKVQRLLKNNLRSVTHDDAIAIYEKAY